MILPTFTDCAASTLKDFGLNPDNLGADIGMTGMLYTQTRRLDYHPHCHFVVPGGGIHWRRRQWIKLKAKFLFNEFALAKVFRACCLQAIKPSLPFPVGCQVNGWWIAGMWVGENQR